MIDFRYHLVSLISVFLALALGIIVGTTQLNGRVLDDLRDQVHGLTEDRRNLASDNRDLQRQIESGDQFAALAGPRLVKDVLKDRSVVVITAPRADEGTTKGVLNLVEASGAEVTGRLQLADDYVDPRRAEDLKDYVTGQGQPAGFQLPETDDAGMLGGALLAHVLVDKDDGGGADPSSEDVKQVLSGLSGLGMLRLETSEVRPADLVVLIATGVPSGDSAVERANSLTELALQLDQGGKGLVVAGDEESASGQGVVEHIRKDDSPALQVSTVDNADTPAGQVSAVLALAQQDAGEVGHYGLADNAKEAFPRMDDDS